MRYTVGGHTISSSKHRTYTHVVWREKGWRPTLARGVAAAVTGESGEAATSSLVRGRRRQSLGPGIAELPNLPLLREISRF